MRSSRPAGGRSSAGLAAPHPSCWDHGGMPLLTALHGNADVEGAVTGPELTLSRHDLLGWASAVAADLAGVPMVAVHATASVQTVVAVTAGLLAGVPVVPVPPDAGLLE